MHCDFKAQTASPTKLGRVYAAATDTVQPGRMCPRPLGVSPKPWEQSASYSPGLVPSADMAPGSPSRRYVLYARRPVAHISKIERGREYARWGGMVGGI